MKLFELIEPRIREKNIYASDNRLWRGQKKMRDSKNTEMLGQGSYGQAVGHKNRPNSVIKSGVIENYETDGYLRYIRTIGKLAASNPYFPRVYDIKVFKNDDGNDMYTAEIEKLVPMEKVDVQSVIAMGERAFFGFEKEANASMRETYSHKQGKGSPEGRKNRPEPKYDWIPQGPVMQKATQIDQHKIVSLLAEMLQEAIKNNMTIVKDPLLKQALMVVKKLSRDSNSRLPKYIDIHGSNVMARMGPGGSQLVITDPLI